ncbi:hypothetical protein Taro_033170 [Colocasia esculenta]|uniref:Uncharacterized protein n=1 Tax=Colocasia esculenta TaxID=4460 RepID=A0A843W661_COLES|nr:hypothetical protein [Colocasia esculenta]
MSAACRMLGARIDVSRLNATGESVAFSQTPSVDTSSVGSPRFCVSQARECSELVPVLGSFPTEPVTREAHPYLLPGVEMAERRDVGGDGEGWKRQLSEQQYLRGLFGPGKGNLRSRNSFKEAVVEAGNRVFRREVFSRVVVIGHQFQRNPSRVRQGIRRYLQLSDVIIVGSPDI